MAEDRLELDTRFIRERLLQWWDYGHARLPWRRERDPYAIWVAEIMLQQTQVATVIPYFERWMERFPTVAVLATASLDDVLKQWEGLGYYSRARNLHAAAHVVMAKHAGMLPDTVQALQQLPGIGRYTAGAIASIAFDRPVPVLDGNVIRVLARLGDLPQDVTTTPTKALLWATADALVPADRPGDFNQALMELGQEICRPLGPRCLICPLRESCLARARGTQLERPVRPPRRRVPHYHVAAAVIWRSAVRGPEAPFLITRRPLDGMLGGLWEFPGGKQERGESLSDTLQRELREELAIQVRVEEHLVTIQHAYTHFRITLHAFHARHVQGEPQHLGVAGHAWVNLSTLDNYPFAVTDLQIIAALRAALS